jgi:hypothetical protein
MHAALKVEFEILSLIAKELALINDDTDLLWKPARCRP